MIKTKTILVEGNAEIKSGLSKTGRAWTLTKITDQDGIEYTTLNGGRYPLGNEITIQYDEVQNGKFTNRSIVENKPTTGKAVQVPSTGSIKGDQLDRIEEKVDELIRLARPQL